MKSYLQYTGKWRIIVDIIKKGKKAGSRTMVPTSLPSMVKRFFEDDELLDERAINYYKKLEGLNVHLHLNENNVENDEKSVDSIANWTTNEESIEEPVTPIQDLIKETSEEIEETETPQEQSIEEVDNSAEETVEEVTKDDQETVDNSTVIQEIEESDRAEMIAYLDATYDKDGLKNLAKEFGVEFNSRISTEKLIEKLIDEKYPQILEMMK